MKLLACLACLEKEHYDLIAFNEYTRRTCACGQSWAKYGDRLHVDYDGPAAIISYPNENLDLIRASTQITDNVALSLAILPPRDGVLRPNEYCLRCPSGGSLEQAWRKHLRTDPLPGPLKDIAAKITSTIRAITPNRNHGLRNAWPTGRSGDHREASSIVAPRGGKPKGLRRTGQLS
jgi:hypothetical protein